MRILIVFIGLLVSTLASAMPKDFSRWELHQRGSVEEYNVALVALRNGELAKAEQGFQKVVHRESRAAAGWYGLAVVWMRQNKIVQAIEVLEDVATSYPRGDVAAQLSKSYFAQQQFELAHKWGQLAVEIAPTSIEAQSAFQWALMRMGNYPLAFDQLVRVRQLDTDGNWDCLEIRLWIEKGQFERAGRLVNACKAATSSDLSEGVLGRLRQENSQVGTTDDTVTRQVNESIRLIHSGRYDEGIEGLDTVLKKFPGHSTAKIIRGTAHYLKRDYDNARSDLRHAVEATTWVDVESDGVISGILTRSSERAFLEQVRQGIAVLVLLYAETGEYEAAESVLERALAVEQSGVEIAAATAALRWYRQDREEAWVELEKLYQGESENRFLLRLMSELAHGDSDSVPASLRAELIDRGSWKQAYNLAAGQSNQGRFEECRKTSERALVRFDEDKEARSLLSDLAYGCALSLGDLEKAFVLFSRYGEAYLSQTNRLRHGALLVNARRGSEALVIIKDISGEHASLPSIQVAATLDAGDLDAALKWAKGDEDPELTYELSFALVDAARFAEAVPLLERCCPLIDDPDCPKLLQIALNPEESPED